MFFYYKNNLYCLLMLCHTLKSTLWKVNYDIVLVLTIIIEIGTHHRLFEHVQCNILIIKIFLITYTYLTLIKFWWKRIPKTDACAFIISKLVSLVLHRIISTKITGTRSAMFASFIRIVLFCQSQNNLLKLL